MKKKSILITSLVVAASTIIGGSVYKVLDTKRGVPSAVTQSTEETEQIIPMDAGMQPNIVERVISSSQLWRPVQDKVKDTVVQVFSHVVAPDLILPYAPPSQGGMNGTAFFISDEGHMVTNSHVVANGQAKMVYIQVPSLGKQIIDAEIVGISPDRDLALLKVSDEGLELIRKELGSVPYLPLGNSDLVRRSDDLLALGFPLGQQSLKSTTGVVSGHEDGLIQISAPINPGSSGGPTLNTRGEVIGINSSGVVEAQNVGYAIPSNDLKVILDDLQKVKQ